MIYMVTANDTTPGNETIFGFYPSRELAEARKVKLESDPDNYAYGDIESNETDFQVSVHAIPVTADGADTSITLR